MGRYKGDLENGESQIIFDTEKLESGDKEIEKPVEGVFGEDN